jgi:SAM-dependent methyltransferase
MTEEQLREVVDYYAQGVEVGRLATGRARLEFERTKEIIERFLPPPPAYVVDVGGATGAYAEWLASAGYQVHLVDPVPLHIEQVEAMARRMSGGLKATLGEARQLPIRDGVADGVLLFGPLYHLPELKDRGRAWREAARVVRPGGHVLGVVVSRFAGLLDMLFRPDVNTPGFVRTAYFHDPEEVANEVETAGLVLTETLGVEGPGWLLPDFDRQWERADLREQILRTARLTESEPSLRGLHSHLIAVGRKPAT